MLGRSIAMGCLVAALSAFPLKSIAVAGMPGGSDRNATVTVECTIASPTIRIEVVNHRKIGKVLIEVRSEEGKVLYREEGKALTHELVRRLDKGAFPKGGHTITVKAKDLAITQHFTIE